MASAADRIIGLYQRHADAWAEARHAGLREPLMEAAWLDRFCRLLPAQASVLDLGCGSGEPVAGFLLARGCRLLGVDSSPPMIALCEARLQQGAWRVGDMRSLSLGRRFDGIVAWDSFFHLDPAAQRRMFPIFRAHAASRAVLMFTSGPRHGEAIGSFGGEPLYHASLDPAEYRTLLRDNDFAVLTLAIEDPGCGGHTIWLAQRAS